MRSAEKSGVTGETFGSARVNHHPAPPRSGLAAAILSRVWQISPVTLAVAATALLSATAFTAFDIVRSTADNRDRGRLVAESLAGELAALSPDSAATALIRVIRELDPRLEASLIDGELVLAATREGASPRPRAARAGTDPVSPAEIAPDIIQIGRTTGDAGSGVWQRSLAAYAAAFLVTGLAFRRREPESTPATGQPLNFADLVETIPFGIACWTESGELIAANGQYASRLGIAPESFMPGTSYHAAVKRLALGGYVRLVSENDNNRILELHREDGSCLLIDERPVATGGFITLVTDVTERKQADILLSSIREEQRQLARRYHEEKLRAEAASRSKTNFLAHLSHDIRTPLNHIIGFAELMQHQTYGPLGDARYVAYLESIKSSGERLLMSFATILELAELEGGQKILHEDLVSVDQLLQTIADRFRAQAARAGLAFVLGPPCEAMLLADKLCVQRMLGNIVENAIRFTPSGGKVTLAAFAAADGVVLEVSDTGLGMSEERLESLSQPFVLGDAAFTREHGGAGLGIAIARAIAQLSGGHLAIDSSPAMGTTVAISLPLRRAQPAGKQAA